jgi:subtilisin family serine protease
VSTLRRILLWILLGASCGGSALAAPLSTAARAQLSTGRALRVLVEFDGRDAEAAAVSERARRGLRRDDAAITALRSRYYARAQQVAHGTNVSAIALGVAPGAKLAMLDVFNGNSASSTDIIDAMNWVLQYRPNFNTVAVNMSFGDGSAHASQCSNSVFAAPVRSLLNAGILSVAAAGNSGSKQGLANPACVPGVVSVGAVYDASYGTVNWGVCTDTSAADAVACFSQSAAYLTLLAPGSFVQAPDAGFTQSGTSQAAPHVTGSIAVLRARYTAEATSQTVARLRTTPVSDSDGGNTTPRLDLLAALSVGTALSLAGTGPAQAISRIRATR